MYDVEVGEGGKDGERCTGYECEGLGKFHDKLRGTPASGQILMKRGRRCERHVRVTLKAAVGVSLGDV